MLMQAGLTNVQVDYGRKPDQAGKGGKRRGPAEMRFLRGFTLPSLDQGGL